MRIRRSAHFALVVLAVNPMFIAACHAAESTGADALVRITSIYDSLPLKIKRAGVINAATETDYPPFEFLSEDGQLVGADVEISMALGKLIGVPIKGIQTDFSSIIPGLAAGRFDVGISAIGDYVDREQSVDFLDYYRGGTSFLVRIGEREAKTELDLCGTSVGALKGTDAEAQLIGTSKRCVAIGKAAIDVKAYPTHSDAILALKSGRIQSVSGDPATNGYSAQNGALRIKNSKESLYSDRPYYGIAVPKNSPLFEPFMDAMKALIDSGVYIRILQKWAIADGSIPAPLKNQPSIH